MSSKNNSSRLGVILLQCLLLAAFTYTVAYYYTDHLLAVSGVGDRLVNNSDAKNYFSSVREILFPSSDGYIRTPLKAGQELIGSYYMLFYKVLGMDANIIPYMLKSNHILFSASVVLVFLSLHIVLSGSIWKWSALLLSVNKDLLTWQSMVVGEPIFYFFLTLLLLMLCLLFSGYSGWRTCTGIFIALTGLTFARVNGIIAAGLAGSLLTARWIRLQFNFKYTHLSIIIVLLVSSIAYIYWAKPDRVFRELTMTQLDFYSQMGQDILPPLNAPTGIDSFYFYSDSETNFERFIDLVTQYPEDYLKLTAQRAKSFIYLFSHYRNPVMKLYFAILICISLIYLIEMPKPITRQENMVFLYSGVLWIALGMFNVFINYDYDFKYHTPANYCELICFAISGKYLVNERLKLPDKAKALASRYLTPKGSG